MSPGEKERRTRRSNNQLIALRFQLETTKQQASLRALALSTEDGLLLAWAGDDTECEELGAVAPVLGDGPHQGIQLAPAPNVDVREFELQGHRLFLSSCGGAGDAHAQLGGSVRRVERILLNAA